MNWNGYPEISFKPAPEIIEEALTRELLMQNNQDPVVLTRIIQTELSKHGYVFYQP